MTDPAPSPPAGQPPAPHRPMPRLGRGVTWSAHPHFEGVVPPAEPYQPPARTRPSRWAKAGDVGTKGALTADEQPVTVPARPYGGSEGGDAPATPSFAIGGFIRPAGDGSDVVPLPVTRCLYETGVPVGPPAAELLAMADDLNSHGGLDEQFVAGLLQAAADPLADAKRQLGIVGDIPPGDVLVPAGEPMPALAPTEHQHIWTMTSPARCVECRHYLRPWWWRALDRVRRPR